VVVGLVGRVRCVVEGVCVCECVKGWCVGEGVVAGGGWRAMGPRSVEVGVGWWVGFRELGWVRDSLLF
jgi:hypothetical protein